MDKSSEREGQRVRYLSEAEESALGTVILKSCSEHLPEFEIALMTGMRRRGDSD